MKIRLIHWALLILLLTLGCSPTMHLPDPQLARYATIALAPVTFSTHQALSNERETIATVLERELSARLRQLGYTVVQENARADARLTVDISYIWDSRLYGDESSMPFIVQFPELRLYADVTLTDRASGKVLLRTQAQGRGAIEPPWSPPPEADYVAPQQNLARRISQLFPRR